ncbi:MAG: hypothetical protein HY002_00540 [Candidatus Rokubacteria bacterium]|nr:hypothetical protein [Candidatus Rokubacteria bacterium]
MGRKVLAVLLLAALVGAGCSAAQLKAQKDDAWARVPQALPDSHQPNPSGYGHPFRGAAFVLHPVGVALDWILVKPFYMLAGLAPEWFGLTAEDAQRFQSHHPELITPQNAPRRFE